MGFNGMVIDVHSHVLPGIDDGARDMDEALAMLRMEMKQGVIAVIATPHYSRRREMPELRALAESLQQEVEKYNSQFQVYLGQETYYHEELAERLSQKKAYTMVDSRYVLVEFDPGVSYQTLFYGIRKLVGAGYRPILAHMERYACLRRKENLEDLCGCGCWMQMNYESLEGHWYQSETRWCRRQVQEGRIQLLGTDMHRMDYRPPELREALEWLDGHVQPEMVRAMTSGNALRIIKDKG